MFPSVLTFTAFFSVIFLPLGFLIELGKLQLVCPLLLILLDCLTLSNSVYNYKICRHAVAYNIVCIPLLTGYRVSNV